MTEHPVYGEQLQVESYEIKASGRYGCPWNVTLGSGAIKGVGAALAARIVKRFQGGYLPDHGGGAGAPG